MIKVGDLVKGTISGKVGIVTKQDTNPNYYYVQYHDNTYVIHKQNLEPLEKK
jgi:hypothetical protein